MDVSTLKELIALITALVGLIGTGIGVYFAIKGWIKAFKEKDNKEKWAMIQEIADAAMKEAEHSDLNGPHKKEAVIGIINSGCKAADIDIGQFAVQVSDYIDSCIN